jgi:hypothetical protein
MTTVGQSRLTSLVAAGVIAIGVMTALAPAANAQTEQQIKAGCDEANGTYSTTLGTERYSECCYHDWKGRPYCDTYINGSYTGTFPGEKQGPPGPVTGSTPPVAPPIGKAPPAATAN